MFLEYQISKLPCEFIYNWCICYWTYQKVYYNNKISHNIRVINKKTGYEETNVARTNINKAFKIFEYLIEPIK